MRLMLLALFLVYVVFISCGGGDSGDNSSAIRVNEVAAHLTDAADWVELYNIGDSEVDISGYQLFDEKDRDPYTFPQGTKIAAHGFLLISADETGTAGFVFGLGDKDEVRLKDAAGTLIDSVSWTSDTLPENKSYGRSPDGTETLKTFDTPTPGKTNG